MNKWCVSVTHSLLLLSQARNASQ